MTQGILARSQIAIALLVAFAMTVGFPARVYANPTGGTVAAGVVDILVTPQNVDVNQHSDRAVIDWRSFDIDQNETTEFHQPNANAIALNRVHSSQASVINGALKANGNVIVVNQNGVLFGRNAHVDVNGLVATTADIDDHEFMTQAHPNFNKPGNPNAAIVNQGQITAKDSGLVGFVAPRVENDGVITARLGRVQLAAGDKATVDFYGDGLMEVAVSDDVRHQLVKNTGSINADGGVVALTAAAGNRILASSLEVGGSIRSQTVAQRGGRIIIAGLGNNAVAGNVASAKKAGIVSNVTVAGNLDASGRGAGQKGGSITVTGDRVQLASAARLDASGYAGGGAIRIGGDFHGAGPTPTARMLLVDSGAAIVNDGLFAGNGGTTALWSDGATHYAGSVSARGGIYGGNGGFVEVSGHDLLGYHGYVDTRAPSGVNGTLLLDPATLTISNLADSNVTGATPFDSTGAATSNLNVGTLVTALGTSNVIVTTSSGVGGTGDITFVDPVSWNSGFSLTANADRHIVVNAAITNAGTGDINLNANSAGGNITIAAPISTAGDIALSANNDILINSTLTSGLTTSLTSATHDIISNASGIINATGALTYTAGRDITIGADATSGGNVTANATRDITLAATRTLTNGAANNMTLNAAGGSTAGTGNLTLNGNLNVGTGSLTLVSGINGVRPSWTATTTNLLRQGATFGTVNISGFLGLTMNRALNSSGNVTLTSNNTGGNITVGATGSVSGGTLNFTSALDTTINGAVTATGSLTVTSGQDIITGAAATTSSGGTSNFAATRDITMASGGALSSTGVLTMSGRDITLGALTGGNHVTVNATRNITTLAGTTITNGAANNLTLNAAGGSTAGTGNLTLNGILNMGTGTLALSSGINGTRPSWTMTAANLLRQGATFGAISIQGFLNFVLNRDINSTSTISLLANNTGGNITVSAGRTIAGTNVTTNSNLDTTINGALNASGTLGMTSAQDVVIAAGGSTSSGTTTTFTVTRDLLVSGTATAGTTLTGTVTRDINEALTGSLVSTGAMTLTGRDITLGNVTAGGNFSATATRDLTTRATTTITPGAASSLTLYAANNVVAGTGNLTLNGILNAGTGGLNLTSGVNGTRPSMTFTTTNLLRQGATFGPITITGFLDTTINRDLNSNGSITITSFRDLTLGATFTLTPAAASNLSLQAANNVVGGTGNLNINGIINMGTGTLTLLSGVNGTRPNYTITTSNLLKQGATFGAISLKGFQDITVNRDIDSNSTVSMNAYRDITQGGGFTFTPGAASALTLTAANNSTAGTGNLTLNGTINMGTGALTLTSGINGTRPSYTMTNGNFTRQGATWGNITIAGFLDTTVNRDINSNGSVSITSMRDLTIQGARTLTSGAAGGITLYAANNVVAGTGNLNINGVVQSGTGALNLTSGVNGTRPNFTFNNVNLQRVGASYGAITVTGFLDTFINDNLISNAGISITSFRDLTLNAANTVTTGTTGALTLRAANNAVGGTGNLYLNGNMNVGNGGLTLLSGINGARQNWTATTTNLVPNNTNFGAVSINGFLDTTINRDMTSTAGISINAYRDLTISATRTVTTSGTGALRLTAANNSTAGTGNLTLNGNIGAGSGGLTLTSGINGTRPNWTATTTNLLQPGASFGVVSITGFQDLTIDRDITGTTSVTLLSNRDLTINAARTVTTGATGALSIRAANAVVGGTGRLTINGNIGSGTGALTLLSGINGTRPTWTANTTTLLRQGATFGAVNVQGFADFIVDRPLNSTSTVTFTGNTRVTLSDDVTSSGAGSAIAFTAQPVYIAEGVTANVTTNNGAITFGSTLDDTIGGAADNLVVNSGTATTTFTGAVNGIGLNATGNVLTFTPVSIGNTRALQAVALTSTTAFSPPSITADTILVRTTGAASNLTIAAGRVLTASNAGTAIVLAAGQNFINNNGVGALVRSGGGRYIIYSTTPGSDTPGGLTYDERRFSCSFATAGTCAFNATINSTVIVPGTGNVFLYSATPMLLVVNPVAIADIIYGAAVPNLTNYAYVPFTLASGYLNMADFTNDVITGSINGQTTYTQGSAIGSYDISYLSGDLVSALGYGFDYQPLANAFNVLPRHVTVDLTGTAGKVYDGNNIATLAGANYTINNIYAGDLLTLGVSNSGATYNDKNVGVGKTVTVNGLALTGAPAGNYVLDNASAVAGVGTITQRALTVGATAPNRVYNGTASSTATLNDDRVVGDVLTITYGAASFADKNVGVGKTVTISGINVTGADAGNYSFNAGTTTTADITPYALTVSATGSDKVYDGNATAGVTLGDDRIGGDALTITYGSALFPDKNVGNGRTINVTGINVAGADAGNYTYNNSTTTAANITPRALTVSATGIDKVYNGNANATVTLGDDRVGGDVLTLGYGSALFPDKNVGNGRTVTVTGITLGGADAGNYTFNAGTTTTANITPYALTVGATGVNRVYDGTNVATVNLNDDRIGGDALTITYGSALFGNKNVGVGKAVNVTGISVAGADAGNYTYNNSTATTADITARALTVSATGIDKVYNGNAVASVTIGDDRVGGDVLTISFASALFPDKNVGNGRTITVSGINVTGADSGNYSFNNSTTTSANITPRALAVSATGIDKVYDGNANATVTLGDNRVGGDALTLGYGSALFPDKNVGNGRTVTVSGINVAGADAGNYTFNAGTTTTANITPYALTVGATGVNRVYDGTNVATVNLSDDRVGGDALTITYGSALFGNKNVGVGKAVNVAGISVAGADAGNYTYNNSAATTADITARALTISATGINKVYNGTTTAGILLGDDRVGGDVLTLGYGAANFSDKNVGNGKTITVTGLTLGGADAGNYTYNVGTTTTADITPRALTVSATGADKIYDGNATASVALGDDRVGGDVLVITYGSALFPDKNVGNGRTVTVSGINVAGADAGNYTYNAGTTTTANITPYALTVGATGVNRVYDGTNVATVNLNDDRIGGDALTITYGSALFGNKNVGVGKAVNVAGISVAGADAGNYTYNNSTATTADITARALTVSASGIDKVYDGNATAGITLGDDRVGGDVLIITYGSALFPDKNVGNGRTITVSGINVAGADAGNYSFNAGTTTTANITQRALTVGATGINKTYDGSATATVNLGDDRVGGDVLILTYGSALFPDKNVGNGRAVNVSGISLAGVDAGNYSYNTTASTTADIAPRALTVGASGIHKVYDGNATAGVTLNDDRVAGDVLSLSYGSALFPDKNVGNGRTVTVSGINVTGADAGNYTFNNSTTTTANITPHVLTVSASGSSKIYDGNANATVIISDDRVGGDVLVITYGSALFPDKNAGVGRTITVSGINVAGADAGNYTYNASATTSATITPATLTATAGNQSIVYGVAVPSTTLNYSGFVAGEDETFLAVAPTVSSGQSGIVNAGTYNGNYTVGGGVDNNYSFVYVSGNLIVGKKMLNVTADNQTITYGTAVPAGTLTYTGFIAGEDETDLLSIPVVASGQSGIVNAGTYNGNYTVSGAASNNYDFTYFSGNLVVNKKDLNITANNQTITYGQSVPAGSLSYSGFAAGDSTLDLDVLPSLSSAQSGVVNAGSYAGNYTVSGGSDNNYVYHYAPGTLTVTPAGLNITVNNQSVTYGTVVPGTTITYTGFVNGDDEFDLDVLPFITSGQSGIVNAGTYAGNYTASGAVSGNYTFNYVAGDLVVSKKALNVTAGNRTIVYGTVVPGTTLVYSGFIAGEDVTYLTSAPTVSSTQSGIVNAGSYVGNYTISGGAADNYYFNFTPGDLTVTARTLNVSAVPQSIVYGTAVPAGSLIYSGFAPGEDASYLPVAPTVSSGQSGIVNAGTYVNNYTVGGGVAGNYTFVYTPADLVVTKRTLTVTANGQTITYGTVVPGTTLSYSGFAAGESVIDLIAAPSLSSAQSGIVNAGTYVGNYTAAGGVAANYDFVYTPGTLTVNRAALSITANNTSMIYGNGNVFAGYTPVGLQLGETIGSVVLSTDASLSAGGHWNSGSWNITASGAAGGTFNPANYTITYFNGSLNIGKRTLTVTPVAADKTYDGTDLASVTLTSDGLAGDVLILTYGDARFPDKQAGNNRAVTVTGIALAGADANNYIAPATAATTATITKRALVITPVASDKLYNGSANATVSFGDNRVAGDIVVVGYGSATFPDASVGTNRVVTISGVTLTGADSANYSFAPVLSTTASIYSVLPPPPPMPVNVTPNTVVKVSQDTNAVVVTSTDDGIYATPATGYILVYLPYDAPTDNRVRNKPIRAGVGVPIIEPTAFYGEIEEI